MLVALLALSIGFGGLARAEPPEKPFPASEQDPVALKRYQRFCQKPKYRVALSEADRKSLGNAAKLLTDAKICRNLSKEKPPREPGCLIETLVKGGAYEKLKLRERDFVIGTSEGPILSIDAFLTAIGAIHKAGRGCLVVTRQDWSFGIGYYTRANKAR